MKVTCRHIVTHTQGRVPVTVLVIGPMDNLVYIVADGREEGAPAMLIDPSGDSDAILKALGWFDLKYVVCTHNHSDHVEALPQVVAATGAKVVAHPLDAPLIEEGQPELYDPWARIEGVSVDVKVSDGDVLKLGSLEFKVIHTPGHTPGGICLYLEGADGLPGQLFSGDTLFNGATGRVDFEGGSERQMRQSMRTKLALLPDNTIVYPGHNDLTTIGRERMRTIMAF